MFKNENESKTKINNAEALKEVEFLIREGRTKEAKSKLINLAKKGLKNYHLYKLFSDIFAIEGKWEQVIYSLKRSIIYKPRCLTSINNMGIAYSQLGQFSDAINLFRKALIIDSKSSEIRTNLGNALQDLGDIEGSIKVYLEALKLQTNQPQIYFGLANAYKELGKSELAIQNYEKAIRGNPTYLEAINNLALSLEQKGEVRKAIKYLQKALKIEPYREDCLINLGQAYEKIDNKIFALMAYKNSLMINPKNTSAISNIAHHYKSEYKYRCAINAYRKLLDIDPIRIDAKESIIECLSMTFAWEDSASQSNTINEVILDKEAISPGILLALNDDPAVEYKIAQKYFNSNFDYSQIKLKINQNSKIRIGYFSGNFYEHAVMHLIMPLFEKFNKSIFEVYAYSFGDKVEDSYTNRIKVNVDCFRDIRSIDDDNAVDIARKDNIDIAIDLMGYTKNFRMGIFAKRVAPIQISYLGYPGTTGSECIDYIISDKVIIPEEYKKFYSEKVIYMPNSYQSNDNRKVISDKKFSRSDWNLPEEGFVFTCFSNIYKIDLNSFSAWMKVLLNTKKSVLWLLKSNKYAESNLQKAAYKAGIEPNRIIFANRVPLEIHLARHQCGDLFLDTFNYNSHTTASDALWAGMPLVSLKGKTFSSRVGASLLTALGLDELITSNVNEYISLAIELAQNQSSFNKVKNKTKRLRLSSPLFNSKQFMQDLETHLISLKKANFI